MLEADEGVARGAPVDAEVVLFELLRRFRVNNEVGADDQVRAREVGERGFPDETSQIQEEQCSAVGVSVLDACLEHGLLFFLLVGDGPCGTVCNELESLLVEVLL